MSSYEPLLVPRWSLFDGGHGSLAASALPPDAGPSWFFDLRSHTMAPLARGEPQWLDYRDQEPAFIGLKLRF